MCHDGAHTYRTFGHVLLNLWAVRVDGVYPLLVQVDHEDYVVTEAGLSKRCSSQRERESRRETTIVSE